MSSNTVFRTLSYISHLWTTTGPLEPGSLSGLRAHQRSAYVHWISPSARHFARGRGGRAEGHVYERYMMFSAGRFTFQMAACEAGCPWVSLIWSPIAYCICF